MGGRRHRLRCCDGATLRRGRQHSALARQKADFSRRCVAAGATLRTLCRSLRDMPLLGVLSEKLPARRRLGERRRRSAASLEWWPSPPPSSSPLLGPGGSASCGRCSSAECRRDSLCASSFTLPADHAALSMKLRCCVKAVMGV